MKRAWYLRRFLVQGLPDDRLNLLTAFRLRQRFGPDVPLVLGMSSNKGLAKLLPTRTDPKIHVVGLRELTSTMHEVTTATDEMLAREVHRDYVQDQCRRGLDKQSPSMMVPWHMLSEEMREPNREAVAHYKEKLAAIGYQAVPVREIKKLRVWTGDELEKLARMEHKRYLEERLNKGWQYGPKKDPERKLHPALVPYDELSDDMKENTRAAIRAIPVWLAKAGIDIRPVSS
jgi:hypothetical protein